MKIAQEEIFGPVMSILKFKDVNEVVERANKSLYGLAAAVWTTDMARAFRMSKSLQSGTVWVNTYRAVSPLSPFGGSGLSGHGRENGVEAVNAFTKTKSIWIELSETVQDPFVLRV